MKFAAGKKRTSFNWSKLIPSVAIKTNYLLTPTNTEPDGFAAGLLLHNQMSTYWNIVTNVSYVGIDSKESTNRSTHLLYLWNQ